MNIVDLSNKKILIAGYGKEGKASEIFLKNFFPSAELTITDKKDGENYLENQKEFDLVIKTPGIKKESILNAYTTATNIFFSIIPKKQIIGVTGSKGKSTTSSLVNHLLQAAGIDSRLVGNIGRPALEELLNNYDEKTIFVYELSSYQLDDIEYSPHIALITSLFPEHMNYHGSVEEYYQAKNNILSFSTNDDIFIYNPKFEVLKQWAAESSAKSMEYIDFTFASDLPLIGKHNEDNMRAAITVAKIFNVSDDIILKSLHSFQPLRHRLQRVGTFKGITFYDDAISTTPESTIAALEAIPDVKTLFLGGENRGYDFQQLIQKIAKLNISNLVLFPETGAVMLSLIQKQSDYEPHILETNSMEKAVKFAFDNTPENSVCLLSTASPSYSIWKNFEEKGKEFQLFIEKIANE